jgi:hypothetical protein
VRSKNILYAEIKNKDNPDVVKFLKKMPLSGLIIFGHSHYTDAIVSRARQIIERIKSRNLYISLWDACTRELPDLQNIGPIIHNCIMMNVNMYTDRCMNVQAMKKVEIPNDTAEEAVMENVTSHPATDTSGEWVTAKQAHELGIKAESTIQKYAATGLIPFKKGWNGVRLFLKSDLIEFFDPTKPSKIVEQSMDARLKNLEKQPVESVVQMRAEWKAMKEENEKLKQHNTFLVDKFIQIVNSRSLDWQTVETMPDDGTPILAYYHGEIYSISHHAGGIIYLNHPNESDMQILIKTEFEWWAYMPDVDHL